MAAWWRDRLLAGPVFAGAVRRLRCSWMRCCCIAFACLILLVVLFHGCEQRQIIRTTPQMDVDSQFWVRVLLATNATQCTLSAPSPIDVVRWGPGSAIQAARYTLEPPGELTTIALSGGKLVLGETPLANSQVVFCPQRPHVFSFNGDQFRGKLQIIVNPQGQGFDAINLVPIEPYLAGVVGEEMPDYWEPEALKAQAIAARTYCLYTKSRFGVNRTWDVGRTQANQVYGGVRAESSQAWNAVNSTAGKVLVANESSARSNGRMATLSSVFHSPSSGIPGLFPAYYSSVCGGYTADSNDIFGESFGPLKSIACPYCQDVARLGLFFWPMAQFDRRTVTKQLVQRYPKLDALGEIKDIVVIGQRDCGDFSRLTRIRLVGATGKTDALRAEDLRLAIDPTGRKIKSTICRIVTWGDGWAFLAGRGWGHGVGMCQCGAEGLARLGKSADEILRYYYTGCQIASLY
jgi:stage II sporulation protein D